MKYITRYSSLVIIVCISIGLLILHQLSITEDDSTNSTTHLENGIMLTNGLRHSVPLEDIIFDDFDSSTRSLPLTMATSADIERLRDRIAPICADEIPECAPLNYEDASASDRWMGDRLTVLGFVDRAGQAYAYPFNILNFHEIVNDTLADEPILISYCPLCNSAIVYSRLVDGQELVFGNTSALYNSDMVMYDTATDSFWFQVEGRAIVGDLIGTELTPLPSFIMTWGEWKNNHPDTLILARPRETTNYARNPFLGYDERINQGQFFFPVDAEIIADTRLDAGETVLLVEIADEAMAYPLGVLGNSATHDTVGDEAIVIFSRADAPSGVAYYAHTASGTEVQLIYDEGLWRDTLNDSQFNFSGLAVSGELQGESLVPLATRYTYWFAAVATNPDVTIYAD